MDALKGISAGWHRIIAQHRKPVQSAAVGAVGVALAAAMILVGSSKVAQAATCNGQSQIIYSQVESPNLQGSIDTVQISVGAQDIDGGTKMTLSQIYFDLDCAATSLPGCTDQGAIIRYQGDADLTTTCTGQTVTSNHIAGTDGVGADNHIVFTLTPPLEILANTLNVCLIEFKIKKLTGSDPDATPYFIEERAGFENGSCDNGLAAASLGTGALDVATPTPTPTATITPTPTPTPTPTDTPTPTPTRTPTPTPTVTQTPTQTPRPTNTPPPVPVVPSPTSPAGLLMVSGLVASIGWMLRRLSQGQLRR